jgi:hypothetical protein
MSCLINKEQRRALRVKLAADILAALKTPNKPFNLEDYIQQLHDSVKKATDNDQLALDAAVLVPTLALQILATDQQLRKDLKDIGITFTQLEELEERYSDVEFAKRKLVVVDNPVAVMAAAQKIANTKAPETSSAFGEEDTTNDFAPAPGIALQTYALGVLSTDPNSPDYLLSSRPDLEQFQKDLISEINLKGLNSSIDISDFQGITGGVYVRLMTKYNAYELYKEALALRKSDFNNAGPEKKIYASTKDEVLLILTDRSGNPIKIDVNGKVSKDGTIAYFEALSEPTRNAKGNVITKEEELAKYIKDSKAAGKRYTDKQEERLHTMRVTAQKSMYAMLDSLPEPDSSLSEKEAAQFKKAQIEYVEKHINGLYNGLNNIRKYLSSGVAPYLVAGITGSKNGFINNDEFNPTLINDVSFPQNFPFSPQVIMDEQASDSYYTKGASVFSYPNLDTPLRIIYPALVNKPEVVDTVVDLFTKPLYIEEAGDIIPLDVNARKKYLRQYISTALTNINFTHENKEKNTASININGKNFTFNTTQPAPKELVEAIRTALTKPFVFYSEQYEGEPATKILQKIVDEEKARSNDPNFVITDLADAKPGRILKIKIVKGDSDSTYYTRIHYPIMTISKDVLNSDKFLVPSFTEKDGKTFLSHKEMSYKKFIKENFHFPERIIT